MIQSSLRILSGKMQSDIGLLRKSVFFLEKPVGFDLDFAGIFAAGFRAGLRPNRSDRFPSNLTIGYCRNCANLMLGKSRIMPASLVCCFYNLTKEFSQLFSCGYLACLFSRQSLLILLYILESAAFSHLLCRYMYISKYLTLSYNNIFDISTK